MPDRCCSWRQPTFRRPAHHRVDGVEHRRAVRANLDRYVLLLAADVRDRGEADLAGRQHLAFVAATERDEPLRQRLDVGGTVDHNRTWVAVWKQVLGEGDAHG